MLDKKSCKQRCQWMRLRAKSLELASLHDQVLSVVLAQVLHHLILKMYNSYTIIS